MSSISDGTTTLSVISILGWSDDRESGNVMHDIIGRSDPDVTLHPARARSGSFQALCTDMVAGWALRELLAGAAVLHLVNTDLPDTDMDFVLVTANIELDDVTLIRAVVTVEFRQVFL
jgi:hypothetical protein